MKIVKTRQFSGIQVLLSLFLVIFVSILANVAIAQEESSHNSPVYYISPLPDADSESSGTSSGDENPTHNYLTAPPDLPAFTVDKAPGDLGEGYIFTSMYSITFNPTLPGSVTSYLLILDNNAEPVFYDRLIINRWPAMDFKKQPNGLLTYFKYAGNNSAFIALNQNYQPVNEYRTGEDPQSGKKYSPDAHDLQLLSNGHALLLIHDAQTVDMSEIVPGGSEEAVVIGCIIQEVDENNQVEFQWRSWDHIDIRDTHVPLDRDPLRYIHCNSVEEDYDGNLLLSSRNLDEITKIDRQTGEIIWRMGGKQNDFTFVNEDDRFSVQHDARRLPNGHITIYDNSTTNDKPSRGIEYRVDESAMTVEKVAEYRNTPDTYGPFQGNMQRLPNGNTFIGWGSSSQPILTEFDESGRKILDLDAGEGMVTYRAFRFPWQGYPTWPPVLAARLEGDTARLHFSWNGSTATTGYKVFGGRARDQLVQLETVARNGFETIYSFELPAGAAEETGFWYFRVVPFDGSGKEGLPSNYAYIVPGGDRVYFSVVAADH